MSSSIAMSTTASGSSVTRPALSQLVAAHTSRRSIWRCARDHHLNGGKADRISRRIDKYHRHPQANIRRRTENRQDWPSTAHRNANSCWGWGLWRSRSSFSDFSAGREKSFWDAEREQMHQRMAHLREHIAKDPYGAIFGRRLDPVYTDKHYSWPNFLRSFMNTESEGRNHSSKSHLQDFNFAKSSQPGNDARDMLQYDPISGRMAPKPPSPSEEPSPVQGQSAGIDCPPGSEVEAKFAANPSLVEDGQFQPGSTPTQQTSETKANAQSIECPPGSELEALFTTDPTSYKEAHVMTKVPHGQEDAVKPNMNIVCPPGNELEALFISESARTEPPHAETLKVEGSTKKLDADAGLSSGVNVECAPGSELEAMFVSKPAAQEDQSCPMDAFDARTDSQKAEMTVDCPPGHELDAKFAAECAGAGPQTATISNAETGAGANAECSPGSELEAKILSESRSVQEPPPTSTVDCPPGSELEAKFIVDPASAEDGQYQPAMTEPTSSKKANVTVDCAPGSELEALFTSDAASSQTRDDNGDVGALSASDIRARYASMASANFESPASSIEFDGPEDRVGDFLKSQIAAETNETCSSAAYRILAYDASISKVSTSEADSFFGTDETAPAHEILSRLHNPAKFIPYFAQMQKDGYEIATGGGDILVFRKNTDTASQSPSEAEHNSVSPMTHAEIAKFIRHDSYDLASDPSSSSTTKVSRQ